MVWIDFCTNDDDKAIEQIAQTAGFSKIPIPKLATGFYSAYEDYDTGLGIMLPSVTVKIEKMRVEHDCHYHGERNHGRNNGSVMVVHPPACYFNGGRDPGLLPLIAPCLEEEEG